MTKDKRPDPRARKHPHLWQAYMFWEEMMLMKQRHTLRLSAIERGKSNLDAGYERQLLGIAEPKLALIVETHKQAEREMHLYGKAVGPIWDWLIAIKGIGPNLAAKLLAQIDYPAPFPGSYPGHCATISKLRRFAGWAVMDGQIDRPITGTTLPYNKTLKAICWQVMDQFIKQQTPLYVDLYYERKEREYRLHPSPICNKCDSEATRISKSWKCRECGGATSGWKVRYTPDHLNKRAKRQVIKIFLSHLWVKWREFEGLPISEPYEQAILGHTNIIQPPTMLNVESKVQA